MCFWMCCCDVPDVSAVVYSRDPASQTGPRSPVPAAGHGGRVLWCVPYCLPVKPDNHPLVSKHICCYPVNETGKFFQKRSHLCWSVCRSDDMDGPVEDIGSRSCVTRFVKTLLSIMEHGVKPHSKHLTEYFAFLYEFAKMGEEEVTTTYLFISLSIYLFTYLFYFIYRPII